MKKRTAALGMLLLPLYILTACGVVFPPFPAADRLLFSSR